MNFAEYEKKSFSLYADFAQTVGEILEKAVSATSGLPAPQSIQARPKAPGRLKARLEEADLLQSDKIEEHRKDLAGARLIFYTNTDVERFLNSRLIFENFDIDREATKIHHPSKENSGTRYQAIHYVVRLKEERTKLPEYARYKNLRCEIQIQTILNHAWSETSHDIVYKDRPREGFGTKAMDAITRRFNDIMDKYLMPAGYEFQRVQHDYERLQQGKELFDSDAVASLASAKNNNERRDILMALKDQALPNYDDIPAIYGDLRGPLVEAAKAARVTPVEQIDTPFGKLRGQTPADVVNVIVEIFDLLKYADIVGTFDALAEIFRAELDESVRKKIIEVIKRLSEYEMEAWGQVGPGVQRALAHHLSTSDATKKEGLRPILITVWQELLSSEISGTTWKGDSVVLHSGAVPVSDAIRQIRSEAIVGLFSLFDSAQSDAERRSAFSALEAATRTPMRGHTSNELYALSLTDGAQIVNLFAQRVEKLPHELLQHMEHTFLWVFRRARPIAEDTVNKFESAEPAKALIAAILAFRDRINTDEDFVRYKVLVGYESIFPQHWEDDDFDYQGVDEFRKKEIGSFVASITPDTEVAWREFIERCASTNSNDMATFPTFALFLERLAKEKPQITRRYLESASDNLLNFLPSILEGLSLSDDKEGYESAISQFLSQKARLSALARHWRFSKRADPKTIGKVLAAAIETDDDIAVIECLLLSMEAVGTDRIPPSNAFFRPALEFLTAKRDARWVRGAWFLRTTNNFFQSLDTDDASLLLANLLNFPRVSHELEKLLEHIAEHHLEAVWRYFGERLQFERSRKDNEEQERYEAVPYDFHGLERQLSKSPALAIEYGRQWFAQDRRLFEFRGGRLISAAFPTCPDDFATALADLVDSGNETDADFILGIMRNYHGEPATHEVLKRIVARYLNDESKMDAVSIAFDSTGVVSGEYGMAEAYRAKREAILKWRDDPRPEVHQFANAHAAELELSIIGAQKRADESVERRRRQFDSDDDSETDAGE